MYSGIEPCRFNIRRMPRLINVGFVARYMMMGRRSGKQQQKQTNKKRWKLLRWKRGSFCFTQSILFLLLVSCYDSRKIDLLLLLPPFSASRSQWWCLWRVRQSDSHPSSILAWKPKKSKITSFEIWTLDLRQNTHPKMTKSNFLTQRLFGADLTELRNGLVGERWYIHMILLMNYIYKEIHKMMFVKEMYANFHLVERAPSNRHSSMMNSFLVLHSQVLQLLVILLFYLTKYLLLTIWRFIKHKES